MIETTEMGVKWFNANHNNFRMTSKGTRMVVVFLQGALIAVFE